MKTSTIQYIITIIGLILSVLSILTIKNYFNRPNQTTKKIAMVVEVERPNNVIPVMKNEEKTTTEITTQPVIKRELPPIGISEEVIYEDMTLTELTNKLNKNLYSTLKDTGSYFANYTKETGLDPYLSLAIVLHETGCKWGCSKLVNQCNNVGGIKGSPSCNGGSYKRYDSLEEGIDGYLNMVYNKYYSQGLTTAELMNPKYAASTSWADAVNGYINTIKES